MALHDRAPLKLRQEVVMGGSTAEIVGLGYTERPNGDAVLRYAFIRCSDLGLTFEKMAAESIMNLPAVAELDVEDMHDEAEAHQQWRSEVNTGHTDLPFEDWLAQDEQVTVRVTLDPAAFGLPANPDVPGPSFDFEAMDGPDDELLELAFAVCNSYPGEMHCDRSYAATVAEYRARRHRSLSVGDTVTIIRNGVAGPSYRCASAGWTEVEG